MMPEAHGRALPSDVPRGTCRFRPVVAPRARLVCLPSAGGAAGMYRSWAEAVPPDIELLALDYPGHGTRFDAPVSRDLPALIDDLWPALRSRCDRPLFVFGHSFGGVVAFELAQRLAACGSAPRLLAVSACPAPSRIAGRERLHDLPAPALLDALRRRNGTPAAVLAAPDLMALLLPALRADLAMFETYRAAPGRLPCPMLALHGRDDPTVTADEVAAWRAHAGSGFALARLPGDHFFIQPARAAVIAHVLEPLGRERLDPCA